MRPGDRKGRAEVSLKNHGTLIYITPILGLCVVGCPEEKSANDASSTESIPDAAVLVVDAGPPVPLGPEELRFRVVAQYADSGTEVVTKEADNATALEVEIAAELVDYRVRLMDGNDQVVESDDQGASIDGGIRYRINLAAPLKPGRNFALSIDAQTSPELADKNGVRFKDAELTFKTRGDYQADPKAPGAPVKKKKSKKR
jgi:hypothetical protein